MNCEEAREQLREAGRFANAAEHLVGCAECREYAEELALLFRGLRPAEVKRSAAEWKRFHDAVYDAVRDQAPAKARKRNLRSWRNFPVALAACAMLAVMTILPGWFGNRTPTDADLDVLQAVYSDYTPFREVGEAADAKPAADLDRQQWTAERITHSGSPTEHEVGRVLNEMSDEEIDDLNKLMESGRSGPNNT